MCRPGGDARARRDRRGARRWRRAGAVRRLPGRRSRDWFSGARILRSRRVDRAASRAGRALSDGPPLTGCLVSDGLSDGLCWELSAISRATSSDRRRVRGLPANFPPAVGPGPIQPVSGRLCRRAHRCGHLGIA